MMKNLFKTVACSAALAMALVGCSSASSSPSSQSSKSNNGTAAHKKLVVGVALSQMSDPFFVSVKKGLFEEAQKENVDIQFADGQANTATQMSQVEDFISKKVDLIVLNPTEVDPLVPAVKEANAANIPVITFDRWMTGGQTVTHVGASAIDIGTQAGDALFQYLGGKGKIAVLSHIPGASTTIDRKKGLDAALKKNPGIQVVADQPATSRAQAMSVTENILTAHPDIQAIYAYNDDNALGASDAIAAAGKQGKVVVTGVGGTAPALNAVKQGKLLATVDILPEAEGQLVIQTAVKVLNGTKITEQHEGRTWAMQQSKVVTGPQWAAKMGK